MPASMFSWDFFPNPSREARRSACAAFSSWSSERIFSFSKSILTFFGPSPCIRSISRTPSGNPLRKSVYSFDFPLTTRSAIIAAMLVPIPLTSVSFSDATTSWRSSVTPSSAREAL